MLDVLHPCRYDPRVLSNLVVRSPQYSKKALACSLLALTIAAGCSDSGRAASGPDRDGSTAKNSSTTARGASGSAASGNKATSKPGTLIKRVEESDACAVNLSKNAAVIHTPERFLLVNSLGHVTPGASITWERPGYELLAATAFVGWADDDEPVALITREMKATAAGATSSAVIREISLIDVASGKERWKHETQPSDIQVLQPGTGPAAGFAPLLIGEGVVVGEFPTGNQRNSLQALGIRDGLTVWTGETPGSYLRVGAGQVAVDDERGTVSYLRIVNLRNGSVHTTKQTGTYEPVTPIGHGYFRAQSGVIASVRGEEVIPPRPLVLFAPDIDAFVTVPDEEGAVAAFEINSISQPGPTLWSISHEQARRDGTQATAFSPGFEGLAIRNGSWINIVDVKSGKTLGAVDAGEKPIASWHTVGDVVLTNCPLESIRVDSKAAPSKRSVEIFARPDTPGVLLGEETAQFVGVGPASASASTTTSGDSKDGLPTTAVGSTTAPTRDSTTTSAP